MGRRFLTRGRVDHMPRLKTMVLLLSGVMLAAVAAGAADYETPANKNVTDVLPAELAKGPRYAVRDPMGADGYMHHYQVVSDFGMFEVTGTGAPRKLAREISAIRERKQAARTEVCLQARQKQ